MSASTLTKSRTEQTPREQSSTQDSRSTKLVCPKTTPEMVEAMIRLGETVSGWKLYHYQRVFAIRVLTCVLQNEGDTITALWARQCGKTEAVAIIVLAMMLLLPTLAAIFPEDERLASFQKGCLIGIFAPKDDQSKIAFSRVREYIHGKTAEPVLEELGLVITSSRADTIALSNGAYFQARTASPATTIEGKTFDLVICEESQLLAQWKVEKEIRPMLTARNGSMVKIGTAGESRGGFHVDIQRNITIHQNGGPRNHYEFPYDMVIAERRKMFKEDGNVYHLRYEKWVTREIERLGGTETLEFRMNFMCIWNESRIVAVSPEDVAAAMDAQREAGPTRVGIQIAGLDLGKKMDRTVLTTMTVRYDIPLINQIVGDGADPEKQVRYLKEITDWFSLEGHFAGDDGQYAQLVYYITQYTSIKLLIVDSTGLGGDIVYETLESMLGDQVTVVPYVFSGPKKSELYKHYFQELKSRRVTIPAGPETQKTADYMRWVNEHLSLDRENMGAAIRVQAMDGAHDDYPDSSALAVWGEREFQSALMPTVEVSDDLFSAQHKTRAQRGHRHARRGGIG